MKDNAGVIIFHLVLIIIIPVILLVRLLFVLFGAHNDGPDDDSPGTNQTEKQHEKPH